MPSTSPGPTLAPDYAGARERYPSENDHRVYGDRRWLRRGRPDEDGSDLARDILAVFREHFGPADEQWAQAIVGRGREVVERALAWA